MCLLDRGLAFVKKAGLREVIRKLFRLGAYLVLGGVGFEPSRHRHKPLRRTGLEGATTPQRVGLVGHTAPRDGLAVHAVTLVVVHRRQGRVDRQLVKIGTTQTRDLRVHIRVNATGQQRIVGKINARNHMRGAKGDLLGLGKKVVGVAVQHQPTQHLNRHQFFGNQLGRVQNVKAEGFSLLLGEHLYPELPLRVSAGFDPVPQVAPVKVGIRTRNFHGFVPHQ